MIKPKVVILFTFLFLLATLSGCVSQPDNKKSQPISVTPQYGKTVGGYSSKAVTLSIVRTDGGKLPELTAILTDSAGKTVDSDKVFGVDIVSSENLLLYAEYEGVYTIAVKNKLNETVYQTNWTISFPHYKVNEAVLMKNGIIMVFRPYQTGKSFQEKGVSYKTITIPVEVKNTESTEEERLRISAWTLKVDKGYTYTNSALYDVDTTLKPKEETKDEIAFAIPDYIEPMDMHGTLYLGTPLIDTGIDFILDLK
jgi:hypothetical protein